MVPETHLANGHVRALLSLIYAGKHDPYPCNEAQLCFTDLATGTEMWRNFGEPE
jgi:hypothetical protein